MNCMRHVLSGLTLCLLLCCPAKAVRAEGLVLGMLAKSVDDVNFVDAGRGCMDEAVSNGDTCVLVGNNGPASAREQVEALQVAVRRQRFSAMALSVINSGLLGAEIQAWDRAIPVITYDSGFARSESALSQAYVGMDNMQFGRDLGSLARRFRPAGGSVCLMADLHDTNLRQRIDGVRRELSGIPDLPSGQRLTGEGGWTECIRCPWKSGDNVERTMQQIDVTLRGIHPDVLLAVGHWPIMDAEAYRRTVAPFLQDVLSGRTIVICAVGRVLPEQQRLLDEGLIHGLVGADFYEIGRRSYRTMHRLLAGEAVPKITFVPNRFYVRREKGE